MPIWSCPFPSWEPSNCFPPLAGSNINHISLLGLPVGSACIPPSSSSPTVVTLPRPPQRSLFLPQAEYILASEPPHRPLLLPETFFPSLSAWTRPPMGLSLNFFLSFFFLNWSIVDLQYCVSFRCTAKWFSYSYICIYLYSFFQFFSIIVYYKILNIVPCAIQ